MISTRLILGPSWVNVDNIFNLKCILSFVFYLVSFTNNQKKEKILNFKVDQAKKNLEKEIINQIRNIKVEYICLQGVPDKSLLRKDYNRGFP